MWTELSWGVEEHQPSWRAAFCTVLGGAWGSTAGYRCFTSITDPHTLGSHFICRGVKSRPPWFDPSGLIGAFSAFLWVTFLCVIAE